MFNRRYQRCHCMNNNDDMCNKDIIETKCQNECNCDYYDDNNCECGFDEEIGVFPENPMLGQSYVPIQFMDKTFKPCVGLRMGTLFPELVSPYVPGQSMREIEFIRANNQIGEGCNKC